MIDDELLQATEGARSADEILAHAEFLLGTPLNNKQRDRLRLIRELARDLHSHFVALESRQASPPVSEKRDADHTLGAESLTGVFPDASGSVSDPNERDGSVAYAARGSVSSHITGCSEPLRIMLAEDNIFTQELMSRLLQSHGHEVVVVENGRRALERLETEEFDLVLMDISMPEMDGLQATEAIRSRERGGTGSHVPIIALTALSDNSLPGRARQAGMNGLHNKPVRADRLFDEMCRVISDLEAGRMPFSGDEMFFPMMEASADLQPVSERTVPVKEGHGLQAGPSQSGISGPGEGGSQDDVLDRLPILEEEHIWRTVADDVTLLDEIITLFAVDAPGHLAAIAKAIEEEDASTIRERAHSLKGAAGAFGKGRLHRLAAEMEKRGRGGDVPGASVVLEPLQSGYQETITALKRMTETGKTHSS
ncbi:MAG: response regulator [Magnetococcales bacterium]|nr:response regulator [Magnetococcales bacterium]